jgi:hypothetical protein
MGPLRRPGTAPVIMSNTSGTIVIGEYERFRMARFASGCAREGRPYDAGRRKTIAGGRSDMGRVASAFPLWL